MWVISTLARYYKHAVDATKEVLVRILMGILIFLGYVLFSLFIYAVMRRIMVPQKLHRLPVHLQYDSRCLIQQDMSNCQFPHAGFLLNNGKKLLRSGHHYLIALEVEAPENQANLDTGVFMVNLTFYTDNKQFLATSARPSVIRYKSFLLRVLSSLFYALPLLLGLMEQKQTLTLTLFENYYEAYSDGAIYASVTLESHKVHFYSTVLTVDANFSGFTYYLYQWPVSMSVIVIISVLVTLCTCTFLLWMKDFINDFEERRAAFLQTRRGMLPGQQGGVAVGGARQPPAQHRRVQQQPTLQNREAETIGGRPVVRGGAAVAASGQGRPVVRGGAAVAASGQGRPVVRGGAAVAASGQGRLVVRGGAAVTATLTSEEQQSETTNESETDSTPTDTRETSVIQGDTESDTGGSSSGLGEVIDSLQTLRQEMDSTEPSDVTDHESEEGQDKQTRQPRQRKL